MPRKTLVKNGYLPRLVDEQIERYLEVFGAVEVAGTKDVDGFGPRAKRQLCG